MDNIIQHIADHADIDTRRALGVFRRLPKSDLNPHPVGSSSWKYWPRERKAIYFDASPKNYMFEVHNEINPVYNEDDGTFNGWQYNGESTVSCIWRNKRGDYVLRDGPPYTWTDDWFPVFQFAAMPDFCD